MRWLLHVQVGREVVGTFEGGWGSVVVMGDGDVGAVVRV